MMGSACPSSSNRSLAAQTTLFGVACVQQMDSSELRGADDAVTRNTVLKSLVAVMTLVGMVI